jgi:hypothetical protein
MREFIAELQEAYNLFDFPFMQHEGLQQPCP